ncbi:MAG: thioredoxin domain-containing protein [Deltaproteobacteria bacterium]|nr:thioredoxin domain-containing protein [Deltaproteobacteria bacterium]
MRKTFLVGLAGVVALGLVACDHAGKKGGKTASLKPNAVKVEFYVMAQCPYGVQVQKAIKPVLDKLDGYVDFHMDFIASELPGGKFKSMHGDNEVQGDMLELCAKKVSPGKYMDFVDCMAKNPRQIPKNWETCAQGAGIDKAALKSCKDGPDGKALLKASIERSKKRNARGSPTIYVANKSYRGGRRSNDFLRSICNEIKGNKPAACKSIPKPPKVNIIAVNDKRCKDRSCTNVKFMFSRLKSTFPGAEIKELDYSTDEGKAVFKEANLKKLPAILFDDTIKKDKDGYQQIGRYLVPAGKYQSLRIGASFDPTAEICDNKKDDTGNGKVDCDDETCKEKLICRKEIPKKLDLFVMAHCPFGIRALNAMKEVLDNFKKDIDFHVHYIGDELPGGNFKSMHGPDEVADDLREVCAIKHYGKNYKFMDFILCRNKNVRDKNWKACAVNGIDAKVIEKCATGEEGKKLLSKSMKVSSGLGIGASPTWIANNKYKFSGIDAETIRKSFCKYNPKTKNCDKKLSGKAKGPAGSCK